MSLTTKLLLFATFVFFMLMMAASYRKRKKRIIFFGDSITAEGALFGGYIQRITAYMNDEGIAPKYDLIGMGKSGNKVTDLAARLSRDILEKGADLVIIFIGINDVWHKYRHGTGTEPEVFSKVYHNLLEQLKSADIRVILCTPTVIGERVIEKNEADEDLDHIASIIHNLGAEFEVPVIDLRTLFRNTLQLNNQNDDVFGMLTRDGVHLNENGNKLVAEEIWKEMKTVISALK